MTSTTALYSSVGPLLSRYELDVERCTLREGAGVTLPANVQYAWRHASLPVLYVVCSSRLNKLDYGTNHFLCAVKIDETTGDLALHGSPRRLQHRPVHVTTDEPSEHVLVVFNKPAGVAVHRIEADGTVGVEIPQRPDLDPGVFPHQVRVTPDNRHVVLVARGLPGAEGGVMSAPGALKVFDYREGILGSSASVTVGDGRHYGSRHLDFHPTGPWVFVSLELQSQLCVHRRTSDGILPDALYTFPLFANPADPPTGHQAAGTVHVHPNGRAVYCVNRGNGPDQVNGRPVVVGPDNTIAVFAVDPDTGEPTLLQHIDSGGVNARTFTLDPTGRALVAANAESHWVVGAGGESPTWRQANLSVFRVLEDGRLEFRRSYEVEPGRGQKLFWIGGARAVLSNSE